MEKGKENKYSCCVLAGFRSMQERLASLKAFHDGDVRFLICTDLAARGLDIKGLPFVVNMTLPDEPENYIHRIGAEGRSCLGRDGVDVLLHRSCGSCGSPGPRPVVCVNGQGKGVVPQVQGPW
jgi:superfamily II DNA/RNA helicase